MVSTRRSGGPLPPPPPRRSNRKRSNAPRSNRKRSNPEVDGNTPTAAAAARRNAPGPQVGGGDAQGLQAHRERIQTLLARFAAEIDGAEDILTRMIEASNRGRPRVKQTLVAAAHIIGAIRTITAPYISGEVALI